jgi:hypothetical protein
MLGSDVRILLYVGTTLLCVYACICVCVCVCGMCLACCSGILFLGPYGSQIAALQQG